MNLIFHHLRKDIRALWQPIVVLVVVLLAGALPDVLLLQSDYDAARWIDQSRMYPLAVFVAFIAWVILLARLIQSEPVTGSTSFWLTRPIPRSVQLPSKALFFALFVFLPTLLPIAIHALIFPPDWPSIGRQVFVLGVVEMMAAITVIWVATYSSSLLHFAGMLCLGFVCVVVTSIFSVEYHLHAGEGANLSFILPTVAVPGFLLSLVVQHAWRGSRWGLRIGLAGLVLALIAQCIATPDSSEGGMSYAPAGKTTKVDFDPDWINTVTWHNQDNYFGQQQPCSVAYATLNPAHTDPDSILWVQGVRANFHPSAARSLRLRNDNFIDSFTTQGNSDVRALLDAKLPGISVAGDTNFMKPERTVGLFTLAAATADTLRGQTGALTLDVQGQVFQLDKMVSLPLNQPHAIAFVPGGFVRVKPLHPGDRQMVVWTLAPDRELRGVGNEFTFVLVDPQTHMAKTLACTGWSSESVGFSSGIGSLQDGENTFTLDGTEPLDRMVLYVFDLKPHLDFETTLTAPNFTMSPPPTSPQ